MPGKPQLLEGSQDLWKHGRLGESEESASRGFKSVILERDCRPRKMTRVNRRNDTATTLHSSHLL